MKTSVAISAVVLAVSNLASATYNSYPISNTSVTATTIATTACGVVSASWAAQTEATATPTVEASLAYDCLNSIPIYKEGALKYLEEIVPYLEWQSDPAFKKNPPSDYFYPPYDFWAELDRVRAGVEADTYENEYAWQADFYKSVFGPGHDGHFVVYPDILTNAVEFARPLALVSVSEDGSSLPVIKVYTDVISSPETASVVTLINGEDATTYIEDWIFQASGNQDADSAYNSMFFSKAYNQSGSQGYFQSGGRVRYIYPGASTTLTFENGTVLEFSNLARLKGDWTGVTDGAAAFSAFAPFALVTATGTSTTATATSTTTIETETATPSPTGLIGYPAPYIISSDSVVSGYFLDGEGFEDVAVLVMTSFSPDDPPEFQETVQNFFAAAVAAGAKKLVVDVQVNGGGYIFQGYDTFRQIFPDIVQNGTGRWRDSAGFLAVAEVASTVCADYDPLTASEDLIYTCEGVWNYRYDLDRSLKNFTSFEDKFGPIHFNGDNYTDVMQWNFNNSIDTINSTYGIGYDVTGYGSRTNFSRPFGGPENVVVLLDGYCASTCTIFSQFMVHDAGAKTIAMGGRPEVGVIQGVGGVKGSESFSYSDILSEIELVSPQTDDADLIKEFDRYGTYILDRSPTASLNVKDEILPKNLDDGTPSQYIAEYADCRLYWTEDMHTDITNLWKAAASAAFDGSPCAAGGFNSTTAKKRSGSRPAPFNKPRFALPKTPAAKAPRSIVKRDVSERTREMFMARQHMMVID
ncbi:hypothetical protein BJ170DRAFT_500145 [Xylariales sp. AK1849]|nr:hypothetical protein BJ170DRAFT_500145 [Xylariales sp. AK1849]